MTVLWGKDGTVPPDMPEGGADAAHDQALGEGGTLAFQPEWAAVGSDGAGLSRLAEAELTANWAADAISAVVKAEANGGAYVVTREVGTTDAPSEGDGSAAVLDGAAMDYFLARQPDASIAVLRFVPVSLTYPDGMDYVRLSGARFLQFDDRLIRVTDIPAEMVTGDGVEDVASDPSFAADDHPNAADGLTAVVDDTSPLDMPAQDAESEAAPSSVMPNLAVTDGGATAEVVDNVISFGAAAAGLVRMRYTVAQDDEAATAEMTVEDEHIPVPNREGDDMASEAGSVGPSPLDGKDTEVAAPRFTVAVTPVVDGPILTGVGAPVTYVEHAASLLIVPKLTLPETEGATLSAARVAIATPLPEDRLVVANWRPENGQTTTMGNITLQYTNGMLLLAGIASLAEYQGVLRMVGYAHAGDRPDGATRSISVTVQDGEADTALMVATVEVAALNDVAGGWIVRADAGATAGAALVGVDLHVPVAADFAGTSVTATGHAPMQDAAAADLTLPDAVQVDAAAPGDGAMLARVGTEGADRLSSDAADIVLGLGGDDRITLAASNASDVIVDGGAGLDTVVVGEGVADYAPAEDAALIGVESVVIENAAGARIDLSRQSEAFSITGGTAADTITGGLGADHVEGGDGDDLFIGFDEDGSDTWIGGAGDDTISFDGVAAAVNIDLGARTAQGATIGADVLVSIENAVGSSGSDTIVGDDAENRIDGGDGDDVIRGGGGDDIIKGGRGSDILSGGDGDDRFCFSGPDGGTDIITDFQPGDRLEITASTFLLGLTNDQISSGAWFFRGLAAQDLDNRLIYDRDSGSLFYDSDGSRGDGALVQIARFDSDDDLTNGFNGCDLDWLDFIIT